VLTIAGNDTTRNSTSAERPALDELFRWATTIPTMRRTATMNTRLGDAEIDEGDEGDEGDEVMMFYVSGNWDERAFDWPERLDLTRTPNRHLGFGGAGAQLHRSLAFLAVAHKRQLGGGLQ
jgi:cholest-4-en-3-one 26-monooxygenase